jgi:heat shock protein HslJ
MKPRRRSGLALTPELLATGLLALALLAPGCTDGESGRADSAGRVTEPPVSLAPTSTTTTSTTTTSTTEAELPPVELEGTAWRLMTVELEGQTIDTSAAAVPAVITFSGDGIEAYDGVNIASGTYRVEGDAVQVELGPPPSPAPYPEEAIPQYLLIPWLDRVEEIQVDGWSLTLGLDDGSRLSFIAAGGVPSG